MTLYHSMRHIDLKEIAARCHRTGVSHRGKHYLRTEPGMADLALINTVLAIKDLWNESARDLRMEELEINARVAATPEGPMRLAASLKRLDRIGQIKLDFDREGVIIRPGSKWIETEGY